MLTCVPPLVGPALGEIELIIGVDMSNLSRSSYPLRQAEQWLRRLPRRLQARRPNPTCNRIAGPASCGGSEGATKGVSSGSISSEAS